MKNDLLKCASQFKSMIDWEYEFIIGRKGISRSFVVDFCEDDFHHLVGLHKLKDNDFIRASKRSKIFRAIISGRLTDSSIQSSDYYDQVAERIDAFSHIMSVLETDPQIFKYSINRADAFSKIDADFLVYHAGSKRIYLFLKERDKSGRYACISLFFEKKTDYTRGQARYTLLRLVKRNKLTGEMIEIYTNPNYKDEDQ